MKPHLFTRAGLLAVAAGALVALSPVPSHAEQFVLFDVTFLYTWENALNATPSKSHYYVKEANGLNLDRPDNWLSPVDYRNGKVHIHVEVLEKPEGGQENGWALCYVGNAGSYGCPYTDYYTEKGSYVKEVGMTDFYNDDTIDWSQGIRQVDLVYTINDSGSGHVHNFPALKDQTTPTKVRIALVQLSAGATFDPAGLPGAGGGGGSSGNAGAGGAGGNAGASGGGGSSGNAGAASGGVPSGGVSSGGAPPVSGGAAGTGALPMTGAPSVAGASGGAGPPTASPGSTADSSDEGSCALNGAGSPRSSSWLLLALLGLWRARRRLRAV